jgi:hypothetical protein
MRISQPASSTVPTIQTRRQKHLIVLGCSATKFPTDTGLPAICLYNGPAFKVLRAFLRHYRWPSPLSIAILSAKHGMIGALASILPYDQRMTSERASQLAPAVNYSCAPGECSGLSAA